VTIHDLAFEAHPDDFARKTAAKYRFFAPRAARGAERVICVSEYPAGDVVRRYGVDAARIRVVPNAPSLYEGFGLVVIEAMARGVPVAAAAATALPETGGDAAVYFDPLDVHAMARAINEALDARDDLAQRGRARAAQFSWRRTAEETAAVYRELL
jgi:glycosyltransferase involved in cell wall biosynthesis